MSNLKQSDLAKALVSAGHAKDYNEAETIISQMRNAVAFEGEDPEDVLMEYNLEPDYVFDILQ